MNKETYNSEFNQKLVKRLFETGTEEEHLLAIDLSKPYFSKDEVATMVIMTAAMDKTSSMIGKRGKDALYECFHRYILNMLHTRYSTFSSWFDDMINESYVAILEHLHQYDPQKGKPTTFFDLHIKSALNNYISRNILNSTPHYTNIQRKLTKAKNKLEEHGIPYTPENIKKICPEMSLEQIVSNCDRMEKTSVYIDLDSDLLKTVADTSMTAEDIYIRHEEMEILNQVMNEVLTEKERQVIDLKYEIGYEYEGLHKRTMKDIAEKLSISQQEARTCETRAIRKMYRILSELLYQGKNRNRETTEKQIALNSTIIPFTKKGEVKVESNTVEVIFQTQIDL